MRKLLALPLTASLVLALAAPASAATKVIVLPGATSAEGITAGAGSTFYASELFDGDIYRGDIRRGTAELFIDAPEGTESIGMDVDLRHHLLYVAGGDDGSASTTRAPEPSSSPTTPATRHWSTT